jgi:Fe2+ or Zn2+ uptake regulation protein
MNSETSPVAERTFQLYLRSIGMKGTHQRSVVLRVFLKVTKPVSASELLYPVKQEDLNVSFHCVYRTLKLIVASGLVTEIRSGDGVMRYAHEMTAHCGHQHLVCKDCGASVGSENTNPQNR